MVEAEVGARDPVDMLSAALDEIHALRRAIAYEARIIEAHYDGYKTFPKTRRGIAEEQVTRMRSALRGAQLAYAGQNSESMRREARRQGYETLTSDSWLRECRSRCGGRDRE